MDAMIELFSRQMKITCMIPQIESYSPCTPQQLRPRSERAQSHPIFPPALAVSSHFSFYPWFLDLLGLLHYGEYLW